MSKKVDDRINKLLDDAERNQCCFVPYSDRDRKALVYRKNEVIRPFKGMYMRRCFWVKLTPPQKTRFIMHALQQQHPDWRFCGVSAAVIFGLPVTWKELKNIDIVSNNRALSHALPGTKPHFRTDESYVIVDGLRLMPLPQVVFDCLYVLKFPDALAIVDAFLRLRKSTAIQFISYLHKTYRGQRGIKRALQIAQFADARSESGGESIARATMYELGFVAPELQVNILDPIDSDHWFRVDFAWIAVDGVLVLGEMDGRCKTEDLHLTNGHTKEYMLQKERLRESHLSVYGVRILRFSYDEVKDKKRFTQLLTSFGVPRTFGLIKQLPYTTRRAELMLLDGYKVLISELVA